MIQKGMDFLNPKGIFLFAWRHPPHVFKTPGTRKRPLGFPAKVFAAGRAGYFFATAGLALAAVFAFAGAFAGAFAAAFAGVFAFAGAFATALAGAFAFAGAFAAALAGAFAFAGVFAAAFAGLAGAFFSATFFTSFFTCAIPVSSL